MLINGIKIAVLLPSIFIFIVLEDDCRPTCQLKIFSAALKEVDDH